MRVLVQGERRGRWLVGAVACAAALPLCAAPARAADAVIPGNPLTISANDNGQLQVVFGASTTGEFFYPAAAPASAGLNIAVTDAANSAPFVVHGFLGPSFNSVSAPSVTGDGSAGNPWVLTTSYQTDTASTDPNVRVDETLTYVNGSTDVAARYIVTNAGNSPTARFVRLYQAADLYVAGNDAGVGFLDQGPPRQVGGINEAAGSSGRLVEQSPAWDHYQEGRYGDVFSVVGDAGAFNDTIDPTLLDNGVGVQWDTPSLALNASRTFNIIWRFRRFVPLTLALTAATKAQGQIATATVTARNSDGNAAPGRPVLYAITGANPGAGALTTGADGTATIAWAGANLGTDTLTAFIDTNANGVRDADEPTQTADVAWTPPPPPVPGKSVVVKVVSGTVTIKYPPGYTPRAASPRAAGFVPFKGAANIPVGSQLDTSKGRVALTSAADTGGVKVQTSDFYQGIF
ncbi:MAG: Ig-like domain-containing protein, partial [Solirubrobacteraceae bacterium]